MSKYDLHSDIAVRRKEKGDRYIFPKRDLGKVRGLGIAFLLFGGFITAFMISWMHGPIIDFFTTENEIRWFMLVFGLMGSPGLVVGLGVMLGGVGILLNMSHAEVLITRDKLYCYEYVGFILLRFKRKLDRISVIEVSNEAVSSTTNGKVSYPFGKDASGLHLTGENMKDLMMLLGYPKDVVKSFADHLSDEVLAGNPGLFGEKKSIVFEEEAYDDEEELEEIPVERPASAISVYNEIEQGCTFKVPPVGIWKGSRGMLFFSILWNGFMAFFTRGFWKQESGNIPGPVIAFIALFWVIGISLLLGAVNMGKRRSLIAVVGDVLGVRRKGIFGTKETKISVEDISDIRLASSGMEVNDVPIMELQIFSEKLKKGKMGLLSQLDEDEIEWIAYTLRKQLGLSSER